MVVHDVPQGWTVCAGLAAAERAALSGTPRDRIMIDLIDVTDPECDDPARAVAIAAVCVLAGYRAFRTRHVTQVQRGTDMAESVLGQRPPTLALRGLA